MSLKDFKEKLIGIITIAAFVIGIIYIVYKYFIIG